MPSGKRVSKEEQRRYAVETALKAIEPIVKQLGTTAIYGALRAIALKAKKQEKLAELERQVAKLKEEVKQ